MDSTSSTDTYREILILLLMLLSSLSMGCPPKCRCSVNRVTCIDAGLKVVPKGIPLSVTEINLSGNPQIHIDRDYFLNFTKLHTLLLKNVSQREPLNLPNSLVKFAFGNNLITINTLEEMFRNRLHSLKRFEMKSNNINLTELFPLMPKGIQILDLSRNRLFSLKRDDLICCKNLIEFRCEACSLRFIESGAFDNTKQLVNIFLADNDIVDLPIRLFEQLKLLKILQLVDNKIEYFNASELRLRYLQRLQLGHNRIKSVDLQQTSIMTIGLENNRIRRIGPNILGRSHAIYELHLENNLIYEMSPNAFQRVKFLSVILLQGNKIESLPGKLFHNTYVNMIFLHNNSISNIDPFIHGMKKPPTFLTLFSNRELMHINTSTFEKMGKRSKVFLSCSNLKSINMSSNIKVAIKCSPSAELIFTAPFPVFENGFECRRKPKRIDFRCHACPLGFYNYLNHKPCTPCPPGSFYQDEVASTRCKSCPLGQYVPPSRSPGKDASDCRTCPDGTDIEQSAGTRACNCLKGFHRRYRFGPCEKCTHNGFSCVRDYPELKQGFWMTWNGTGLPNRTCKHDFQAFIFNLETYSNDYDRNTMHFKCQLPIPIKCPRPDSCNGGIDSNCTSGYTGFLCAVCRKGYSRVFNRCEKCPQLYIVILKFIGCLVLFILVCVIVSDDRDCSRKSNSGQTYDFTVNRTTVDIAISSFKILINFYQTLIGIVHAYSIISWPNSLLKVFSVFEYIQFEVIRLPSLRCINSEWSMDSVEEFWVMVIASLTFPGLCLLYFMINLCHLRFHESSSITFQQRMALCARRCIKVASLFLYVTYPLVSIRIIHILPLNCDYSCTAKCNGECLHTISFLRSDYSLACPTMDTHKYTLITAYCALVFPLGLPIVLLIILGRSFPKHQHPKSSRTAPQHISSDEVSCRRATNNEPYPEDDADLYLVECPVFEDPSIPKPSTFRDALKFTYENYTEKYWYWETVEMIRKLIMTAGAAIFFYNTKIGLSSLIIIGMGFAILHATHKPMKDGFENLLQMISLMVIPLNLSVGALIQSNINDSNQFNENDSESWELGIFLIIINSLIIVLILARFIKLAAQKTIKIVF